MTLHEARVLIDAWRKNYNSTWLHSFLGNITPAEFAAKHQFATQDSTAARVADYGEQVRANSLNNRGLHRRQH
ncbi:hypothetical protein EBAPG3_004620 [Nitrosospira lacus]|uniref:Integrase catalytic domain-containing protein n=1 Tax=Nitrosospira lacus TaxID=1288494 RepID=A0A1W6SMR3_9PROT|nr:hypothetical protein EBAPG3_004620 [Nitrosospira lacus]